MFRFFAEIRLHSREPRKMKPGVHGRGGVDAADEQKKLNHSSTCGPCILTEARVLLTRAATGLDLRLGCAAQQSGETTLLLRVCHGSDSVPEIRESRRGIGGAQLSCSAFSLLA